MIKFIMKSGREIEVKDNMKIMTINSDVLATKIKIGQYIAIEKYIKPSKLVEMSEDKIKIIAYMLGDGNCKNNNLRFSCIKSNTLVLNEFREILIGFECSLKQYKSNSSCDYHITKNTGKINKVKEYLEGIGVYGMGSHDKCIPEEIFKISDKQLKIFLSRIYATDGWAHTRLNKGRIVLEVGYCSVSKKLVLQLQELLLRLGIEANIRVKKVKYNGGINRAYALDIHSKRNILKFCTEIGIFSKEDTIEKVIKASNNVRDYGDIIPSEICNDIVKIALEKGISKRKLRDNTGIRNDRGYKIVTKNKVLKAIKYLNTDILNKFVSNNIFWDKVIEIVN